MVQSCNILRPTKLSHDCAKLWSSAKYPRTKHGLSTLAAIRRGLKWPSRNDTSIKHKSKDSLPNPNATSPHGDNTGRLGKNYSARQQRRIGPKRLHQRPFTRYSPPEAVESKHNKIKPPLHHHILGQGDSSTRVSSVVETVKRHGLSRMKPPRPSKKPLVMPYTTSASEFLYGTSVVKAALRGERRKLYKLYIYSGENRSLREQDDAIAKLALARGVKVSRVETPEWLSLMDRMSSGRPHNGYVLEASPLQRRPVLCLGTTDKIAGVFRISLDHQSLEEATVNGIEGEIGYLTRSKRYPFLLMLDGILDPGNIGAIIRSAFFLGVDAIVISTHGAPLGAIALKSSAGAAEVMTLLSVRQTGNFIRDSQREGWKFYAAVAPLDGSNTAKRTRLRQQHLSTSALSSPPLKHPTVLMIGGEGSGLRDDLKHKADFTVSIDSVWRGWDGLDSLNVSVATALLCETFLRHPLDHALTSSPSDDSVLF